MALAIECVVLCLLMGLICFLGLGNDEKNLKSLKSYPDELQALIKNDSDYKDKIKESNSLITFVSNLILWTIIIFICGLFIRKESFLYNFIFLLILGEIVNLFDVIILDFLWFRNTKRSRFSKYPDDKYYKSMKNHLISFAKGAVMFLLASLIDGAILTLF